MHHEISGYVWENAEFTKAHEYLLPALISILDRERESKSLERDGMRLFELGCGNGAIAHELVRIGWHVTGVDPSEDGISHAKAHFPHILLQIGSAYDDLAGTYSTFPVVISMEVVEHVYSPRAYAATLYSLVEHGGVAIVSTPYHGYLKNLAMALTGKLETHFTALWDNGHIKFWSIKTLKTLLEEAGFSEIKVVRVGRIPALAKAMIMIARKP